VVVFATSNSDKQVTYMNRPPLRSLLDTHSDMINVLVILLDDLPFKANMKACHLGYLDHIILVDKSQPYMYSYSVIYFLLSIWVMSHLFTWNKVLDEVT
jgi:hypothetical protein